MALFSLFFGSSVEFEMAITFLLFPGALPHTPVLMKLLRCGLVLTTKGNHLILKLRHYVLQSKWIEEMMLLEGTWEVIEWFYSWGNGDVGGIGGAQFCFQARALFHLPWPPWVKDCTWGLRTWTQGMSTYRIHTVFKDSARLFQCRDIVRGLHRMFSWQQHELVGGSISRAGNEVLGNARGAVFPAAALLGCQALYVCVTQH